MNIVEKKYHLITIENDTFRRISAVDWYIWCGNDYMQVGLDDTCDLEKDFIKQMEKETPAIAIKKMAREEFPAYRDKKAENRLLRKYWGIE